MREVIVALVRIIGVACITACLVDYLFLNPHWTITQALRETRTLHLAAIAMAIISAGFEVSDGVEHSD